MKLTDRQAGRQTDKQQSLVGGGPGLEEIPPQRCYGSPEESPWSSSRLNVESEQFVQASSVSSLD